MMNQVYIRPLIIEDAATSYKWRNDSEIWRFTKFNRTQDITIEMEANWLENVLAREDERRFAICLKQNDQYIGNIQLLNIKNNSAEFHLFIGESEFWGKGIGKQASALILKYAFDDLFLDNVILDVNKDNLPAIAIYKRMGFLEATEKNDFIEMLLTKDVFYHQLNSKNSS